MKIRLPFSKKSKVERANELLADARLMFEMASENMQIATKELMDEVSVLTGEIATKEKQVELYSSQINTNQDFIKAMTGVLESVK